MVFVGLLLYENGSRSSSHEIGVFMLQVIGQAGDQTDVPILRELCDDAGLGEAALRAIRQIEDRAFGGIQ